MFQKYFKNLGAEQVLFGKENIFLREKGLKFVIDTYDMEIKLKLAAIQKIKNEWKIY